MKNITFYEKINLFLENKRPRKPSACVRRFDTCVCRYELVHAVRVSETYEWKFFCIKD